MATLISQIIQDAYREANIIAVETNPTANQSTEGLRLLNRYIRALFGNELGQSLRRIPYGDNNVGHRSDEALYYQSVLNYFIPSNSKIICNLEAAKTLRFPPNPEDGARIAISDASSNFSTYNLTLEGNGRVIEGTTSVTLNTDGQDVEYFYREDTSEWKQVSTLATSDPLPFPEQYDDIFIIGLAIRLAPRYGTSIAPESIEIYNSVMSKFRARYGTTDEIRSELGLTRLPSNKNFYGWGYSDDYFDKGLPLGL